MKDRPHVKCIAYTHHNVVFWIHLRSILYDFIAKIENPGFVFSFKYSVWNE